MKTLREFGFSNRHTAGEAARQLGVAPEVILEQTGLKAVNDRLTDTALNLPLHHSDSFDPVRLSAPVSPPPTPTLQSRNLGWSTEGKQIDLHTLPTEVSGFSHQGPFIGAVVEGLKRGGIDSLAEAEVLAERLGLKASVAGRSAELFLFQLMVAAVTRHGMAGALEKVRTALAQPLEVWGPAKSTPPTSVSLPPVDTSPTGYAHRGQFIITVASALHTGGVETLAQAQELSRRLGLERQVGGSTVGSYLLGLVGELHRRYFDFSKVVQALATQLVAPLEPLGMETRQRTIDPAGLPPANVTHDGEFIARLVDALGPQNQDEAQELAHRMGLQHEGYGLTPEQFLFFALEHLKRRLVNQEAMLQVVRGAVEQPLMRSPPRERLQAPISLAGLPPRPPSASAWVKGLLEAGLGSLERVHNLATVLDCHGQISQTSPDQQLFQLVNHQLNRLGPDKGSAAMVEAVQQLASLGA